METIQIKRLSDEILTSLTEENVVIARSLDSIKVVDILAMLFISIVEQVSQFHFGRMNLWETFYSRIFKITHEL